MSTSSTTDIIPPHIIDLITATIQENNGNEVFMIGSSEPTGKITSVQPIAFGNKNSVPAPAQDATPGQVLIHNHPSGYLEPSGADISIASVYGKAGIGFYIIDNTCSSVRIVVKPFFPAPAQPVDISDLENLFGEHGHLSRTLPSFEYRPQQLAMMKTIAAAFNQDRIAIIEAATGVGKSFAYLAPAILWSLANKKRVVISTNTINLQEQLIRKDLPDLARQLERDIKAVLVKGRGNYISLRRLKYASTKNDLFHFDATQELESLRQWAETTREGSRSDIPHPVSEEVWDYVMSDKDDCMRAECPHFNQCHFYNSRREATNADIIVANHHLVMADLALGLQLSGNEFSGILPPFDRVIFDEAHNLEEVATNYFTIHTSAAAIRRQLFRISRPRDRSGHLQSFYNAIRKQHKQLQDHQHIADIVDLITARMLPTRDDIEVSVRQHFDDLFFESQQYFMLPQLNGNDRREFRITVAVEESPYWEKVTTIIRQCTEDIHRLIEFANQLDEKINRLSEDTIVEITEHRLRLFGALRKLDEHKNSLSFFLTANKEQYCRWIEIGYWRNQPFIHPYTAPLDIAPNLQAALFTKKKTIILTSATLCTNNDFNYFNKQMGLLTHGKAAAEPLSAEAARCLYLRLDTPFDYKTKCLIGIPNDLPVPADPEFYAQVAPIITSAITITQGRAMVLFTAYGPLRKSAELCRAELQKHGITLLMQGDHPRHKLIEIFKQSHKAALFATSSFWEGVDIQGDALQCLIMAKLPFSVPSTPIFEARAEYIERCGGNAFYEIAIPQAVIKFKQGIGRLIRSHSDHGFVLLLDNRVLTKRYGHIFMKSLPPAARSQETTIEVIEDIKTFMHTPAKPFIQP